MKIYIEGNIGSGKTTFLRMLESEYRLGVDFLFEPLDEWLNFKDSNNKNILDHFYTDQKKNSFMFQMNAFITRTKSIQTTINKKYYDELETTLLIERSVYTDKNCFAKNLFDTSKLNELEWKLYCQWFDWFTHDYNILPDGFIYLRTNPEISYERIQQRSRHEEDAIPYQYIEDLHTLHDDWLLSKSLDVPVLILDVSKDFENNYQLFQSHIEKINKFLKEVKEYKIKKNI